MNGITLPHDIKRYIQRKAIGYLAKLFLWYVAVVAVNIAIWKLLYKSRNSRDRNSSLHTPALPVPWPSQGFPSQYRGWNGYIRTYYGGDRLLSGGRAVLALHEACDHAGHCDQRRKKPACQGERVRYA